ncbi:hypothetical protein ACPPVW_16655 [Leifsonia sp. McL0607]|uniref:hypothetical protein n=1 Tax=Leifsonia sp. McL0607 TaxID=3415672 RepID=UPI003CF7EBC1
MTRARMVRRAVGCVLAAAIVGVAAWFFGMDAPHAVGLGAVVFALGAVLSLLGDQAEVTWWVPPPQPRPGSRRDVVQLGWSLGARGGRVSPEAVRRLRGLATEVLDRHGVQLDDPASAREVARLLGDETTAMLRKGSAAAPRPRDFAASLTRLEALSGSAWRAVEPQTDPLAADPLTSDTTGAS